MVTRDDIPRLVRDRLDDPLSVCASLGLLEKFKRQSGGGVMIRCPAHRESSPSCSVTRGPDKTLRWRCFACSASGDVLTLIATVEGLDVKRDFVRVLEIGAGIAGVPTDSEQRRTYEPPRRPEPMAATAPTLPAKRFSEMMAPLANLGRLEGSGAPKACQEYLLGRGLLGAAVSDGWFAIRPSAGAMLCQLFGEDPKLAGLVGDDGALRWPEHALCIPWRTPDGTIQTIQRRHLGECDAKRRYVFPTGRGPAHPYGIERLGKGPIVLVEGAMDVLARRSIDRLGWSTVLGVPGVSGWRSAWDELVKDRIVTIAFDDDEAGNRESLKLGDRFYKAGAARVRRSVPTRGKDWADAIRRSA